MQDKSLISFTRVLVVVPRVQVQRLLLICSTHPTTTDTNFGQQDRGGYAILCAAGREFCDHIVAQAMCSGKHNYTSWSFKKNIGKLQSEIYIIRYALQRLVSKYQQDTCFIEKRVDIIEIQNIEKYTQNEHNEQTITQLSIYMCVCMYTLSHL